MKQVKITNYEKATASPDVLIIQPETSIGIEEVRQIQNFLSRKPIQQKNNTVYILDAHLLTLPAQNALLKTLEEPPSNSQIYLVTTSPDALLPTVLSRVQIQKSSDKIVSPDSGKSTKTLELLKKFQSAKAGEKLAMLDEMALTRESALTFLDELEHTLHSNLQLKLNYDLILSTRQYLKANVNVKLAMDNLMCGINA
jgi:DNA polymerase III delta prime subunit